VSTDRITVTPVLPRTRSERSTDQPDVIRFRTRGPRLRQSPVEDRADLRVLVGQLREFFRDIPLNILMVGGDVTDQGTTSARFYDTIRDYLDLTADTIWIVDNPSPLPSSVGVVALDNGSRDRRIAANLVADILFMAGEQEAETETLRAFAGRVSLVLIPASAPHRAPVADAASAMDVVALTWDALQSTIYFAVDSQSEVSVMPGSTLTAEDIDDIGKRLGALAKQLTHRFDRRMRFREAIERLMRRHNTHPGWNEDLIRAADSFDWPPWAVQTLPKLYLRVDKQADTVTALVWRTLFDWVDQYEQYLPQRPAICSGEILRVIIPKSIDALLSECNAAIEENLRGSPVGESVFFGRIADAISGIARSHYADDSAIAERLLTLSRDLLNRHGGSRR
jgi:hypothetical protein